MIECIFTLDYEIYGDGNGSLNELVYEPTCLLKEVFDREGVKLVVFVEAAELEIIKRFQTDAAINNVRTQLCAMNKEGHEMALHLHPQWYNGNHKNGLWQLDYSEYNLCVLPKKRISEIIDRAIKYMRVLLSQPDFTPFSFRAGNWLFQPTGVAARVLAEHGIRVDSSVFKGGLQRQHGLDYRRSLKNGYYWNFSEQVNIPDSHGGLLEMPIFTCMVPTWTMLTGKRVGLHKKAAATTQTGWGKMNRLLDFARFKHPLKFDFCRMTIKELTRMIETVLRQDEKDPNTFRPLVAIGHTKDLQDLETVESLLQYLAVNKIPTSTFKEAFSKCVDANS